MSEPTSVTETEYVDRMTIYANNNVSRGKYAAAAVHAALAYYGIDHGAVIVLGKSVREIREGCDVIVADAGLTEVQPGTITAGVVSQWTKQVSHTITPNRGERSKADC